MPIPANQITVAEIHLQGSIAAAGSSAKRIDLVFHYRRVAVAVNPTKAALDTIFQATVAVPLIAAINARFTQTGNTIRWMNDAQDGPQTFLHAVVGGVAGDSMVTDMAAFILQKTALRGKSYRGGKHLGPMSESDTTAGTEDVFNAAALVRLGAVATAMQAALTDATPNTWNPCILSRKAPAQYKDNPTNVITNDVITTLARKSVGVMKHRRPVSVY